MTEAPLAYWNQIFADNAWGRYPSEDLVRFIARRFRTVADKAQANVLEVGSGPGANVWYLVREGFVTAAIDGSDVAIRQLEARLAADGLPHTLPQVDLKVGNFRTLPWQDSTFDAVVDIEAIYANPWADIVATVAEVHRVLKPGGAFFGKMFSQRTTGYGTGTAVEPNTFHAPTLGPCKGNHTTHYFSREELRRLFKDFSSLSLDVVHRTDGGEAVDIVEWLVVGCK